MPFKPGAGGPPLQLPCTRDKPLNAQQELFARAIARGVNKRDACLTAGYKSPTGYALLLNKPNVRARVDELMAETAARHRVTVDEISHRLRRIVEDNQESASVAGQNLARQALMDLAKLNGLLSDKAAAPPPMERVPQVRWTIVYPDGCETDVDGKPVDPFRNGGGAGG